MEGKGGGGRSAIGRAEWREGRSDALDGSGFSVENTRTLKRKSRANGRRGDDATGASTREGRSSTAERGVRIERSRPRGVERAHRRP